MNINHNMFRFQSGVVRTSLRLCKYEFCFSEKPQYNFHAHHLRIRLLPIGFVSTSNLKHEFLDHLITLLTQWRKYCAS